MHYLLKKHAFSLLPPPQPFDRRHDARPIFPSLPLPGAAQHDLRRLRLRHPKRQARGTDIVGRRGHIYFFGHINSSSWCTLCASLRLESVKAALARGVAGFENRSTWLRKCEISRSSRAVFLPEVMCGRHEPGCCAGDLARDQVSQMGPFFVATV